MMTMVMDMTMVMSLIVKLLNGVVVMVINLQRMRLLHNFWRVGNTKAVSGDERKDEEKEKDHRRKGNSEKIHFSFKRNRIKGAQLS